MKRNSRYLLTIVLLSLASAVFSQDEIISFGVYVRDASTHETLNSAEITVMDTDSVNIMKFKPHLQEVVKGSNLFRYLCTVSRRNRYIIKVECKGYDTEYMDVEMKDVEKQRIIDAILLHRPAIQLKEVTVVGSKILMVMKGDTLEYNASALQLSSGSMLDALIRQLPGVELHKGGRITVNGNYVSSLLVNGRDFFKGDPKVALDNLPSYYVDRVKVYHHMSDLRRFQQGDSAQSTEHDPLVMDVKLKRQYAQGWIGSGEFGYGSQNRYQARLFGMRYTEHSGLFVFSNINNLNNTQEAGKDGRWADEGIREGVGTAKTFGLNFTGSDKGSGMKYDTSLKLSLTDLDKEEIASFDKFYASGNLYERNRLQVQSRQTEFEWKGNWSYPGRKVFMQFTPSISFVKDKKNSVGQYLVLSADPTDSYRGAAIDSMFSPLGSTRLTEALISMRQLEMQGESDNLEMNGILITNIKLRGKQLELTLKGNYDNGHDKQYDLDILRLKPLSTDKNSIENRYSKIQSMQYKYSAAAK